MFLLDNSDLPATSEAAIAKAPLLRTNAIAAPNVRPPFALVSAYGSYGLRPGFESVSLELPDPLYVGRYFRLVFNASETENYTVSAVNLVSLNSQLYSVKTDPNEIPGAVPLTAWANTQALNLYAPIGISEGDTATVNLVLDEQIPFADGDLNYSIDISAFIGSNTFTVSRCVSEGLAFTLAANSSDPQTGEFTQVDGVIKLFGDESYRPRELRPVQIEGIWQADLGALGGVLVTFPLSGLDVGIVDELTYLGTVCRPASNLYDLSVGDLLRNRTYATVVVPYNKALWVRPTATAGNFVSGLSEVSYQSTITT